MAIDYTNAQATARRLITENGQSLVIRRSTSSTSDPIAGTVDPGAPVDTPVHGLVLNITDDYARRVGGENIEARDRLLLLTPDLRPLLTDKVIYESGEWSVQRSAPLSPAGIDLYQEVQIRP